MLFKVRVRAFALALVGIASLATPRLAASQVSNGSFEVGGGSFSSWGTIGNAQIQGNSLGSGPTDGLWQALLATATDGTVNSNVVPGIGVGPGALEPFLGVNAGTLLGVGNGTPLLGSGMTQTIGMIGGQSLFFDWNFLTNQTFNDGTNNSIAPSTVNNDFAFMTILPVGDPGSAQIFVLADTFFGYVNNPGAPGGFETGFTITAATNPFISETGFQNFMWTAQTSGQYLLGIGVVHVTTGPDNGVNSGLLIDNVQLDAVPEPSSIAALSLLGLGLLRRRVRKVKDKA
ncbi:MAG: PEP-CTERM sorting domain-containing protein [Fimbriimonadaceae bacterium]|nr:PEP-CTERM sorting domain-containing protein [Fimbriimonadaceae bacterium]